MKNINSNVINIGIAVIIFMSLYLFGIWIGNVIDGKAPETNTKNEPEKVIYDQRGYKMTNGQRSDLSLCMDRADDSYTRTWNLNCKSNNLEDGCLLPEVTAKNISDKRDKDEDQCIELFKN